MRHRLPLAALAATACLDAKVVSDFDVELIARAPVNQTPLDDVAEVRLVLRGDRGARIVSLDEAEDGGLVHDGEGPLEQAWLGLLGTDATSAELVAADVRAYGEVGPYTLERDEDPVSAEVLVAELGRVGDLDRLTGEDAAFGAAAAMTAAGDVFLLGGHGRFTGDGAPTGRILRLTDLDAGTWRFEPAGTLPNYGGGAARVGGTATLVDWNGREAILLAGGRPDPGDASVNLAQAALLTPDDGQIPWSRDDAMRVARSGHQAVRLENGRVLLVGGFEGAAEGQAPAQASYEVFDPGFQVFNLGQRPLPFPALGFAMADLGPEGVLACGGHHVEDRGEDGLVAVPSAACAWISPLGEVRAAASLPTPVTGLAMAAAGDRHVIALGGLPGELADGASTAASGAVWLYTLASDSWQELGALASPRAHARAIPTGGGRVVLVGGAAAGGPLATAVGAPIACTELYDHEARALLPGGCSPTGGGADPVLASHPLHGALVFSGRDDLDAGGQAYGIIPFAPPL